MTTRYELGKAIARAREARGLTQTQVAARLSRPISHAALSDIERGKTGIDIERITELAAVLGVPLAALVLAGDHDLIARLDDLERRVATLEGGAR